MACFRLLPSRLFFNHQNVTFAHYITNNSHHKCDKGYLNNCKEHINIILLIKKIEAIH